MTSPSNSNLITEKHMTSNGLATLSQLSEEEGGGWLLSYVHIPACSAAGQTQEEAILKGEKALELWIEHNTAKLGAVNVQPLVARQRATALDASHKVLPFKKPALD